MFAGKYQDHDLLAKLKGKMDMSALLPSHYHVAPWTMNDLEEAVALLNTCDIAEVGMPDHPLEEVRAQWNSQINDPEIAGWIIRDDEQHIVAFGDIGHRQHKRFYGAATVHPEHQGRGIGTYLLEQIERHAERLVPQAPDGARVDLRQFINDANEIGAQLVAAAGYTAIRHFWRMDITLAGEQPPAQIPTGMTVRPFVPERDAHAVHAVMTEAFQDHWGSLPSTFEEWEQSHIKRRNFDPSQWFVLVEGDEIAGALIGDHDSPTEGFVSTLGVRRPWRGRGVGLSLLRLSFAAFARAGKTSVGLGVDAESLTGATRLYERAGMHVAYQTTVWEKELRPATITDESRIGAFQV